jgi:hypothetical protein
VRHIIIILELGKHTMSLVVVMAVLCGSVVICYYLWPLVDWRSAIPIIPHHPNGESNGALDDILTKVEMEIGQHPELQCPGRKRFLCQLPL